MSARAVRRDLTVPVLLGLLLLLALPSTGLVAGGWGPQTPGAYLLAALLLTAFFVAVVGPAFARAGPGRPLALLVASLPFLAYGILETPALAGTRMVPAAGFWALVAAGLALAGLGRRHRQRAVAVLVTGVACAILLDVMPLSFTAWAGGSPDVLLAQRAEQPEVVGPKRGAAVPAEEAPAIGEGPGPFLVDATRGRHPVDEPLALVFGANGGLTAQEPGFVPGSEVKDGMSPLELDAYDAAIVLPGAWPKGTERGARLAEALAIHTRRGGLLVGPGPGRSWPAPLGQELGSAGRAWTVGFEGAQAYGLGLVVRAASEAGIREALAAGADRRVVGTVFDGPGASAPPLPARLARWTDHPPSRRPQGILLLVYVVIAVLLDPLLRGAVPRVMGLVAPALAVALGLVWTSPADPGVRAHALLFELGGGGGRRLEAVALASGPAGWIGSCRYRGPGHLRLVGAGVGPDGLVRVEPGRTGWILRETVAQGGGQDEPEARDAGFLRGFLRGEIDATRLRLGRGGPLDVQVEGRSVPVTWTARWR